MDGPIEQRMRDGQKAHPLVMRHEATHDGVARAGEQTRGCVVDRLVESIATYEAMAAEGLEVATRLPRDDGQRERSRIGGDDEIVGEPSLETQSGHAEAPVLIDLVHVDRVVARLGDAPGYVALPAVFDLPRDGGAAGLLQQGVLEAR